jgi:type VI secretion system secreted protein VgrG
MLRISKAQHAALSKGKGAGVQRCPLAQVGPTAGAAVVNTGFGSAVDALVSKSPSLSSRMATLKQQGWQIVFGPKGTSGSNCDRRHRTITIGPDCQDNPTELVARLSHETGHALNPNHPGSDGNYVEQGTLSKDQFVSQNVNRELQDEGEATLCAVQVRNEILANGGPDIGVGGAQSKQYIAIAAKYPDPRDRAKARTEIANLYVDGEKPSGQPNGENFTYRQHFAQGYAAGYNYIKWAWNSILNVL